MQQVGEHHDSTEMYVDMAATARTEGLEEVLLPKLADLYRDTKHDNLEIVCQ